MDREVPRDLRIGGVETSDVDLDAAVREGWESVEAGARPLLRRLEATQWSGYPEMSFLTGGYRLVPSYTVTQEGYFQWIGFLAGRLWLLFLVTGDEEFASAAAKLARKIAPTLELTSHTNADVGFDIYYALCLGAEITHDATLIASARRAVRAMSSLFMRESGTFAQMLPFRASVIDTGGMLLAQLWSARWGSEDAELARRHFRSVLDIGLVRGDGTTAQRVEFDGAGAVSGELHTIQGSGNGSTWSRGQAWAIHGYVSAFECFGDEEFASAADALIGVMLTRLGGRQVPRYDLDVEDRDEWPLDTCSAAMFATALLRWSRLRGDPTLADRGREILLALLADHLSPGGVLLHGTWGRARRRFPLGRFPQEDVMPYGNYWVCEAMFRATHSSWSPFDLAPERCAPAAERQREKSA